MSENIQKKYSCDNCLFYTNYASEWNKHTKSMKHQRNGQPKNINNNYDCDKCEYKCDTHWNLKMHKISQHTTQEEREKQKYYCKDCDKVFFCSTYFIKHNDGIVHKNKVIANKTINNKELIKN
jgi:hypothetical protein